MGRHPWIQLPGLFDSLFLRGCGCAGSLGIRPPDRVVALRASFDIDSFFSWHSAVRVRLQTSRINEIGAIRQRPRLPRLIGSDNRDRRHHCLLVREFLMFRLVHGVQPAGRQALRNPPQPTAANFDAADGSAGTMNEDAVL